MPPVGHQQNRPLCFLLPFFHLAVASFGSVAVAFLFVASVVALGGNLAKICSFFFYPERPAELISTPKMADYFPAGDGRRGRTLASQFFFRPRACCRVSVATLVNGLCELFNSPRGSFASFLLFWEKKKIDLALFAFPCVCVSVCVSIVDHILVLQLLVMSCCIDTITCLAEGGGLAASC